MTKNTVVLDSPESIKAQIEKHIVKYPLVQKYFAKAVEKLIKNTNDPFKLLQINLIRYLAAGEENVQYLEEYVEKALKVTDISLPMGRLKSNFQEEYHDVIAELKAAVLLSEEGCSNIEFLKSGPDIKYSSIEGMLRYAEVKNLKSLYPEFTVLHDKLEAKSYLSPKFKKTFFITTNVKRDSSSIDHIHSVLEESVDSLVLDLEKDLVGNKLEKKYEYKEASFVVDVSKDRGGFHLMMTGPVKQYSGPQSLYLEISPIFPRMFSAFNKGYKQLLSIRGGGSSLVTSDRIYLFTGLHSGYFTEEYSHKIVKDIADVTGMSKLVDFQIFV